MLDVVFYHSTQDLVDVEFDSVKPLVVCPSPLVADGLRRLLPAGLEIITVSKWVSDHLKQKNQKKSNKAELMLRLSSVWRHYFPHEDSEIFFRSFEMFTELRSFTLNLDLLSEFLSEVDEKINKSILVFWAFTENEKIIDEHKSYQLMGDLFVRRPLWVIGFKHLSGIQIDMLKEIGEKTKVAVFFPGDVYQETLSTDWIRWIVPEAQVTSENAEKNVQVVYFPKNKLNSVLNTLKSIEKNFDVTLASQQVGFQQRQEVAFARQFFKSPEDLFFTKREKFFELLSELIRFESRPLNEVLNLITEQKEASLKAQDFITYKILTLSEEALALYGEFQQSVDLFSLKVLKQIIELNSPRVSLATLTEEYDSRIYDINELPYRDEERALYVIASSNYGSLKSGESHYSEKMMESLRSVAPLKRAGLEFSYRKSELRQALSRSGSLLLMEEGLELIDLAWREILKGFKLEVLKSETAYALKAKKDYLASRIQKGPYPASHYSASRLQSFVDCPRKYYFNYIEKLDHRPDERMKLGADEMGTLEHAIIRQYFSAISFRETFQFDKLQGIVEETLKDFLLKNKIVLSDKLKLTTFYELLHFSQNGITYLIEFSQKNAALKIDFEIELEKNEWNLTGSIDCIVSLKDSNVAIFDFKRSSAAIGSKKETMAFEKLQIWTYLLYVIRHRQLKIHTWGYLNLSEIDESQVYSEVQSPVISEELIEQFFQLILQIMDGIQSEDDFFPKPRAPKVCNFCEVQLFCSKEACL